MTPLGVTSVSWCTAVERSVITTHACILVVVDVVALGLFLSPYQRPHAFKLAPLLAMLSCSERVPWA